MRILVLDDNPEAVRVFENFLNALDHQVSCYTDPREALLWLNDVRPEVIIADLSMPEIDGFDFIKRVRAYHAFSKVPAIALTGTDASEESVIAAGFSSILRKPVTLSDVMMAIDDAHAPVAQPAKTVSEEVGMTAPAGESEESSEPVPEAQSTD